MNTTLRRLKAGFTLTELMAVVIIVGILAAVASGSFKKAIERSHFSEGLVAANTVLGAVERYYAETCNEGSCGKRPTMAQLDMALANQRACTSASSYCTKTKYFEITIQNGYVDAVRMKGSKTGDYTIRVFPESFGSSQRTSDACIAKTLPGGKDLCISMGYANCNVSNYCYK